MKVPLWWIFLGPVEKIFICIVGAFIGAAVIVLGLLALPDWLGHPILAVVVGLGTIAPAVGYFLNRRKS